MILRAKFALTRHCEISNGRCRIHAEASDASRLSDIERELHVLRFARANFRPDRVGAQFLLRDVVPLRAISRQFRAGGGDAHISPRSVIQKGDIVDVFDLRKRHQNR